MKGVILFWCVCWAIVLLAVGLGHEEDCPASLIGYNCKGKTCDHSEEEMERVKAVLERNRVKSS